MIRLTAEHYSGKKQKTVKNNFASVSIVEYDESSISLGMHYHDNAHFCFLLSGSDKEKRNGESYIRNGGDIYFYPAGQAHGTLMHPGITKSLIIELSQNVEDKYNADVGRLHLNKNYYDRIKPKLIKLLGDVIYNDNLLSLSIESVIADLTLTKEIKPKGKKPKWVDHVKQLLHDNWNVQLSLTELSNLVQVHPVTISRYFNVYANCTLTEYVKRFRVSKSFTLLQKSDLTLTEIAFECGFSDQSHFTRVFKEVTGYSPSKIRKLSC
ncbi:MAG: AraC family transcriptional regulator [Chitinophagaceae bacterium]|jgi:AraC family transcriptional regulator|nr:AraC family transcriptional regulator [Chitinophagaceae bacterium]